MSRSYVYFTVGVTLVLALAGCTRKVDPQATTAALEQIGDPYEGAAEVFDATYIEQLYATAAPPAGWRIEPLKSSPKHSHQVWLSPTGDTAYGVIHFVMPAITGVFSPPLDWVLDGYLDEMRKDQGEATLLSKDRDSDLGGLRFVAEGGLYKTWTNLVTQGRHGWAIYAGALRAKPVAEKELQLAEEARERTVVQPPG